MTTRSVLVDSSGDPVTSGQPVPGMAVTGIWLSDGSGGSAAGSARYFSVTTDSDGNAFVNQGRINAYWSSSIGWNNPECGANSGTFWADPIVGIGWLCPITVVEASANSSSHFVLPGAVPSTITSYGDFSTTYGEPQLRVYVGGATPGFVSSVSASSAGSGSSATFPFPAQSNGSPLAEGFYSLVNTNVASGGGLVFVDSSYLAVGGITALSGPFGVDAADETRVVQTCDYIEVDHETICSSSGPIITPTAVLTQYYSNQVSYGGHTIAVGAEPVAVKFYGQYTSTSSQVSGNITITTTTTSPASAVVVNSGSASVSILDLETLANVANVAVGAQPMSVTLNSAATYAYVASYGSGTMAEVDLSTEKVTRTATGLAGALSVAMDPSDSYVWVGGTNYLYKVSVSTFAVVSSVAVAGSVTSLAVSNTQNELAYTLVQNCCTASSTYAANELLLSNLSTPGSYAHAAASPYAAYTMNGTLPSAAALPQATSVVSTRFSNGMAASATPTGFVIYDVISHAQIMTGTTATPVRGIASDPDCMFAYFTLPDSNEYIAVPLESTP